MKCVETWSLFLLFWVSVSGQKHFEPHPEKFSGDWLKISDEYSHLFPEGIVLQPPAPPPSCTGKNARVAEPDCPRQVLQEITSPRKGKRKERKRDNKQTNKTNERNEFPFYIRLVTKSINVLIFISKPDGFRMPTKAIKCHMLPRSFWLLSCVQPGTDLSYPKIWLLSEATSLRGIKGACPWIW